jgi:hypothetical protein
MIIGGNNRDCGSEMHDSGGSDQCDGAVKVHTEVSDTATDVMVQVRAMKAWYGICNAFIRKVVLLRGPGGGVREEDGPDNIRNDLKASSILQLFEN